MCGEFFHIFIFTIAHIKQYNISAIRKIARREYMAKTVNFTVRVDADIKEEAEELFKDLGLNLTSAVNIFLRECVRRNGIPFEVSRNAAKAKIEELER